MSETELFTMEDADNDGKIKREVGRKMVQNAKTHAPDMYKKFENVCEHKGLDPVEAMGQHVLMALQDESHSKMLANTTIDLSGLNQDEIRLQDAKFIQEVSEELGLNEEKKEDTIDKLIERRLEAKTGPILPTGNVADTGQPDTKVAKRLDDIQSEISRLQARVDTKEDKKEETEPDKKKDVDDLFAETEGGVGDIEEIGSESEGDDVPSVVPSEGGVDDE